MRFMMLYKPAQDAAEGFPPSKEYLAKMEKLIDDAKKSGELIATEGLQPMSKGARVKLSGRKLTVIDGPFIETKELVGGFAILQLKSKDDAIESAKRFLEVAGEGVVEIRQIVEMTDFAP